MQKTPFAAARSLPVTTALALGWVLLACAPAPTPAPQVRVLIPGIPAPLPGASAPRPPSATDMAANLSTPELGPPSGNQRFWGFMPGGRGLTQDDDAIYVPRHMQSDVVLLPKAGGPPRLIAPTVKDAWYVDSFGPHVYFTVSVWGNQSGSVGRASKQGGLPTVLAKDMDGPDALGVDASGVVFAWTDSRGGEERFGIDAMKHDGSGRVALTRTESSVRDLALVNSSVVFLSHEIDGNAMRTRVLRVARGGGEPVTLHAPGRELSGLLADEKAIYFFEGDLLMKLPHHGGSPAPMARTLGTTRADRSMAQDATTIVWHARDVRAGDSPRERGEAIFAAPKTGGGARVVAWRPGLFASGVALDAHHVYWTQFGSEEELGVARAPR
jgi:hypothetical protein